MSREQFKGTSEDDSPQYDFDEFISRYRELEDEINEHRRVTNIQVFASLGTFVTFLLLFTVASRNSLFEKGNLPPFLLAPINAIEGIANFIETNAVPLLDSIPLIALIIAFAILLGITILFGSRRDELEVDNKKVFRAEIAAAAVSLTEESPDKAVNDLRSAIEYGSPQRVLPRYKIEQTKEFLDNVNEIETEEEARDKVGAVIEELISEFEEESTGRVVKINQELERRAKADRGDRGHLKTFIDVLDDKLISEPRRFDVVASGSIVATFLLGHQQFALLLATLFAGARLSDYFG